MHTNRSLIILILLILLPVSACQTSRQLSPNFGKSLKAGLSRQVINPTAPADPSPAVSQPAVIADLIYQQRYIKAMTEEQDKDDDSVGDKLD